MNKSDSLFGKTAVVIGGSGGIGAAVCRTLAALGVNLIIHGPKDSKKFNLLLRDVSRSVSASALIHPFSGETSLISFISTASVKESFEKADILCVCYGPFLQKKLHETDYTEWIDVSLLDYALPGMCISAVLPHMMKNQWGRILLFGGSRTDIPGAYRSNAAYAGAKSGLSTIVKSAAAEYTAFNITCNAVIPGVVETEYYAPEDIDYLRQKTSLRRTVPVDKAAEAGVYLMSNGYINGALLRVDDGWCPL